MCSTLLRVQNEMPQIRDGASFSFYNEMDRVQFGSKGVKGKKKINKPLYENVWQFQKEEVEVCENGDWKLCGECQLPVPRCDPLQISTELEMAGWYHGAISCHDSVRLLSGTKPGTFLVRDSSDPRYSFTLSVQTRQGPLSVRLLGSRSTGFRLEADRLVICSLPVFRSVIALVQHYSEADSAQPWIDWRGTCLTEDVRPVRPLYRHIPSLQHLARLVINRTTTPNSQKLPKDIQSYLDRYPYTL